MLLVSLGILGQLSILASGGAYHSGRDAVYVVCALGHEFPLA
jgi:hypothetical protein